jgi:hypothetical protein
MSGKLCVGIPTNNAGAWMISASRSFCEGLAYRAGGTALSRPSTANPHATFSDDYLAWEKGWLAADGAVGFAVDPDNAPCCAVPANVILA